MSTVGAPSTMDPPWAVMSPMRAAGMLESSTVKEPSAIESGGPTQRHMLPTVAAGSEAMSTVGAPGERMGPPTCGMGGTPGVTMGQTCMSVRRAAGLDKMDYLAAAAGGGAVARA